MSVTTEMTRWCVGGDFEIDAVRTNGPERLVDLLGGTGSFTASGRSAFGRVLAHLKAIGVDQIYVPSFLCESLLQPIEALGMEGAFYVVSPDGSTSDRPRAGAVLVIHYFGWTNPLADELAADPEVILIEDFAHVLPGSRKPVPGANRYVVTSLRKFGPVPLGGWCSIGHESTQVSDGMEAAYLRSIQARLQRGAYLADRSLAVDESIESNYRRELSDVETFLDDHSVFSGVPEEALGLAASLPWERIGHRRRENWERLNQALSPRVRRLHDELPPAVVPLGFVIRDANRDRLRRRLATRRVFCPVHWRTPGAVPDQVVEMNWLPREGLTLPIDQRYDASDIDRLASEVERASE
ncbi:MAG: hypothetical protein CME26_03125 [Gemmatimonadetes bacterium]|nr:hypothetical protein [Gemmatimonadota bacterium]